MLLISFIIGAMYIAGHGHLLFGLAMLAAGVILEFTPDRVEE